MCVNVCDILRYDFDKTKKKKKRQYSALAQAGPRGPGVQGHSFHANFLPLLGTVPWNAPELLRSPGDREPDNRKLSKLPSCLWEENEIATGVTGLGPDGGDGPEVKWGMTAASLIWLCMRKMIWLCSVCYKTFIICINLIFHIIGNDFIPSSIELQRHFKLYYF